MLNNLDANAENRLYSRYISAVNNAGFKGTFADYKTAIQDRTGKPERDVEKIRKQLEIEKFEAERIRAERRRP